MFLRRFKKLTKRFRGGFSGSRSVRGSVTAASCRTTAFRLAMVSVKRVVRTYHHIKTGWCAVRRVAHLRMAAARNWYAADDGASNLWLCSSGSLRVTLVVRRLCAGRHHRNCKHNGRNNRYDCFHRDPRCISARQCRQRRCFPSLRKWFAFLFWSIPSACVQRLSLLSATLLWVWYQVMVAVLIARSA
jgi:hypothetical protein